MTKFRQVLFAFSFLLMASSCEQSFIDGVEASKVAGQFEMPVTQNDLMGLSAHLETNQLSEAQVETGLKYGEVIFSLRDKADLDGLKALMSGVGALKDVEYIRFNESFNKHHYVMYLNDGLDPEPYVEFLNSKLSELVLDASSNISYTSPVIDKD